MALEREVRGWQEFYEGCLQSKGIKQIFPLSMRKRCEAILNGIDAQVLSLALFVFGLFFSFFPFLIFIF